MQTYGRTLRQLYDRLTGQAPDRSTAPISTDDIAALLEHSDAVQVTRLPASVAPATRITLHDDEPGQAWDEITTTYDVQDPELVTGCADDCSYEIHVDYYNEDLYSGQFVFHDLDEDTVWATLNDI